MSHFSVLVIGKDVDGQLAPYKEDLKVEWVDTTQEHKDDYENDTVSTFYCSSSSSWGMQITQEQFEFIKNNPIGTNKKFEIKKGISLGGYYKVGCCYRGYYELPNGKRCQGDAWFKVVSFIENKHWNPDADALFEGTLLIQVIDPPLEIPVKVKYPDYDDYLREYHGIEAGEAEGYWKNPNGHWDWYSIGGRWGGFFKSKNGNGVLGNRKYYEDVPLKDGYVDVIEKEDVDFIGMRQDEEAEAAEIYDRIAAIVAGTEPLIAWEKVREEMFKDDIDAARDFYHAQPRAKAFAEWNKANKYELSGYDLENFNKTRDEYIKSRGDACYVPFALVKDGKWYQRGDMGWWGAVSDEMDRDTWNAQVVKMIEELPGDTQLTIVDCHT